MGHTLSILAEDHPGVLMRIAGLIYRRGYNIQSLSVGPTHEEGISRFTVVIQSDRREIFPLMGQLRKLIEVLWVQELQDENSVDRRIALIKVRCPVPMRQEILRLGEIFRCRVVDLGDSTVTFEVTGDKDKIEACIRALMPYGVLETASSGSVCMNRETSPQEAEQNLLPREAVAC
ncbi:acetolactate synthase, small subunit [Thermanaerovibrio velox DSM 12556]|uniref:Acetolactate synthase small subunit n=1 Tax=Thermanaerovibrio velox DSM 12556 TaxID=926567 RepID=H0UNG4_9BACT|nr:acetolactate synthase small subunit [Thermanaerovibrio velox]EHM09371.1 acetolactate synthase, small subunit [Thermanaerovibrio velox DSM 12556]